MHNKPIYVTQPTLPKLEEFIPHLQKIWDSRVLTNGGNYHQELEKSLKSYLGVKEISLFCNGTIALITALKALDISGEVITTPYSFVATSHALRWNGITPVFVDIDPKTFNIDSNKIEAAITSKTSAILGVHCYGVPCNVHAIDNLAKKYNLKVIYDAAHAFGVKCRSGRSVLEYGDLSILSFHATKVFNTFEGGGIVSHSQDHKLKIDQLKNFGFMDELTVVATGINGKMSEFNALIGLLQLENLDDAIEKRKNIDKIYRSELASVGGINFMDLSFQEKANYSYFPLLIGPEYPITRDKLYERLREKNIFARRYFYPLITDFPMYRESVLLNSCCLSVAKKVSSEVLCLPIYPDLDHLDQLRVIHVIKENSQ